MVVVEVKRLFLCLRVSPFQYVPVCRPSTAATSARVPGTETRRRSECGVSAGRERVVGTQDHRPTPVLHESREKGWAGVLDAHTGRARGQGADQIRSPESNCSIVESEGVFREYGERVVDAGGTSQVGTSVPGPTWCKDGG